MQRPPINLSSPGQEGYFGESASYQTEYSVQSLKAELDESTPQTTFIIQDQIGQKLLGKERSLRDKVTPALVLWKSLVALWLNAQLLTY